MSGLGHFLEDEGLPTVQISLIREHREIMRPPRALWVPFVLGRPLGQPDDPAFQKRVLRAALALLEAPAGPVLEDYPEEAEGELDMTGWVCPVAFPKAAAEQSLAEALRRELQELKTWYDMGLERRGRTAVGGSELGLDEIADLLVVLADGKLPENPRPELKLGETVRLAAEDLKAFYQEAATAQPGDSSAAALGAASSAGDGIEPHGVVRIGETNSLTRPSRNSIRQEIVPFASSRRVRTL